MKYHKTDRVLMIINDEIVDASLLQRYGFLLYKQYQPELSKISNYRKELKFYEDWKPFYFGPFSKDLDTDIKTSIINKLLVKRDRRKLFSYNYYLTLDGRKRWRFLQSIFVKEMESIQKRIKHLQGIEVERLLIGIYEKYPEYNKLRQ